MRRFEVARVCALLGVTATLGACGPSEVIIVEPDEPNLSVVGYVTIDLNPAYGVVGLYDAGGSPIGSTVITAGRYGISRPLDPGTVVCDGYTVRAFVLDDFGPRQDTLELTAESGTCVMPDDASIEHWLAFDLPQREAPVP